MRISKLSQRQMRIGGSIVVAVLMVASGYILPSVAFPHTKQVNAELTDELLASYVAKDTDNDTLPDWQEVLYGTDAHKADTDGDGINDGEAVRRGMLTPTSLTSQLPESQPVTDADFTVDAPAPGSVTDAFSRSFFEAYMKASGGQPMEQAAQDQLIAQQLAVFQQKAAAALGSKYTRVSLHTDASLSTASYAGAVEDMLDTSIPDAPDSDLIVLTQRFMDQDDAAAGARLSELSGQYARAAIGLAAMRVPPALTESHLQLIQSLDVVSHAAKAITTFEQDPVLTMGALSVLPGARDQILGSLTTIAEALLANGEPAPGAPGKRIIDAVRRLQTSTP